MIYATVADYLQRFGQSETWQSLVDECPELDEAALAAVIGGDTSGFDGAVLAVVDTAVKRLIEVMQDAETLIDGYLRGSIALPLSVDQINRTPLKRCCLDMTRCLINDDPDNATERMDKVCESWRSWLSDVSKGKIKLFDDVDDPSALDNRRVLYGALPEGQISRHMPIGIRTPRIF